jgi:hypothetical protein
MHAHPWIHDTGVREIEREWSDVEHNRCRMRGKCSTDEKFTNRGYEITRLSIITWNLIISPIPSFCFDSPLLISAPVALRPCPSIVFLVSGSLLLYPYILACIWMNVQLFQTAGVFELREIEGGLGFHLKRCHLLRFVPCVVWIKYDSGALVTRRTEALWEKPDPLSLCPVHIA